MLDLRIPYFYIIRHIPSGCFYAGCKFGKDANPDTFMTLNGYQTSSPTIQNLIVLDGLESFETILVIKESDLEIDVYSFETEFLESNNIANDPLWFNCHNNTLTPFGSDEFKQMMVKIHGVEHGMKIKSVIDKIKQTSLEKYGVTCSLNTPDNIVNRINGCLLKFGSKNNYEQIKKTNLEKYGVENLFESGEIRDGIEKTIIEKHGGMGFASTGITERYTETMNKLYGVDNFFKQPDFIQENAKRSSERWADPEYKKSTSDSIKKSLESIDRKGEKNSFHGKSHSQETIQRIIESKSGLEYSRFSCLNCKLDFGVNNFTQHLRSCKGEKIKTVTCPHCGKEGKPGSNMNRWHFDNCKHLKE
jgi:hypothetical protein